MTEWVKQVGCRLVLAGAFVELGAAPVASRWDDAPQIAKIAYYEHGEPHPVNEPTAPPAREVRDRVIASTSATIATGPRAYFVASELAPAVLPGGQINRSSR